MNGKTQKYEHDARHASKSSADLNWENEDHQPIPIDDPVFIDPWALDNNDAQIDEAHEVAKRDGAELNSDYRTDTQDTADLSSDYMGETSPYDGEVTEDAKWQNFFREDTERTNDFAVKDTLLHSDFGGLYDFDEGAQRDPWELEPEEPSLQKAKTKAATITRILGLPSKREQDEALYFLVNLFEHRTHAMTFRAIQTAAEDLDLNTLKAMVELRNIWEHRSGWWYYRYRGQIRHMQHRGETALSWTLARRVCLARWEYPPEMMIDDKWFDEWMATSPGTPGYVSFPAFIAAKTENAQIQILCDGFDMMQAYSEEPDLVDDYGWWRQFSDASDLVAIRQGAF